MKIEWNRGGASKQLCVQTSKASSQTGREEKKSTIFNNVILCGYTVSLNEPISCHCVKDFKEYLNVGICCSRRIKRTFLPIKSPLYGHPLTQNHILDKTLYLYLDICSWRIDNGLENMHDRWSIGLFVMHHKILSYSPQEFEWVSREGSKQFYSESFIIVICNTSLFWIWIKEKVIFL